MLRTEEADEFEAALEEAWAEPPPLLEPPPLEPPLLEPPLLEPPPLEPPFLNETEGAGTPDPISYGLTYPGPQRLEYSEHSAPSVCEVEEDSQYSGTESDDKDPSEQDLYDRFDELWPTECGAKETLEAFSGPYIQSMVNALENIAETCRNPPYEPYEPPKPQGIVLARPKRVPTPPVDDEEPMEELPLPPPPVVSYRKKCNVPLAVQAQERERERIRQGQIRAFGKPWSPPKKPEDSDSL